MGRGTTPRGEEGLGELEDWESGGLGEELSQAQFERSAERGLWLFTRHEK